MSNIDFDTMLYRTIANGKEFEKLIPKSKCVKIKSGVGETDFSMKEIKAMSEEYSWQMQKVAQLLVASSFKGSLENIKDFIYNHFQYKADKDDQMMRSPACSWYDRHTGIDCKSYSILASCILSEMQIVHHIRRIKQPSFAPNDFTHVYVIVPIDQATGDLKKGYYTIDGTLKENIEPLYVQKDDILMSLQHYRLNGPLQDVKNGNFKLKDLSIGNVGCMSFTSTDHSAYSSSQYTATKTKLEKYYNELILRLNQAVLDGDQNTFNLSVNEFFGMSDVFVLSWERKRTGGWNKCTNQRIDGSIAMAKFFRDVVGTALEAWLNDNFIPSITPQTKLWTNVPGPAEANNIEHTIGVNFIYTSPHVDINEPIVSYNPKPKVIKQFVITPYLETLQSNPASFNLLQFISSLGSILTSFAPNNQGNTGIPNNGNGTNYNNDGIAPPQIEQSGFGIAGWLIVGVGVTALMTGGFKNSTTKKTK